MLSRTRRKGQTLWTDGTPETRNLQKKSKSKDNPKSSGSRRSAFSLLHTNTEHKKNIGVDDIQDLHNAPIKFKDGKDIVPDWEIRDLPSNMQRMHNWYKWACRLGLQTISTPHHPDVFGVKGHDVHDIMFDF